MTQIKICCIRNIEEAQMAIDAGANAIGLVSAMPSGPGVVDDKTIIRVSNFAKGKIEIFLLTSETMAERILHQHNIFNPDYLQLVDYVDSSVYKILRREKPDIKIVQVIHVTDFHSIEVAIHYSALADRLLLDSGNPGLQTKVLGGTGKTHNWSFSREIIDAAKIPVFLAGGLSPNNVREAVDLVNPFGVDVCSGLRVNEKLQIRALQEFVKIVRTGALLEL